MVQRNQDDGPESLGDSTRIEPIDPNRLQHPPVAGRFEIVRLVAVGGYTRIYEVTAPDANGRRLALKLLNAECESISHWFERSASVTGTLSHAHVLPCLESGRIDGRPYTVMPLVDGDSVVELVHRRAVPEPAEVVGIARSVASALDYAHGRDVIHGNVHPKHVLLDRAGHVWLTGFAEVGPGWPGEMCFGNPHHLAPEQSAGIERAVPQTDVYALAEVVFLLLTGSFPFGGGAAIEQLERKRTGQVPSVQKRRPELPHSVDLVLRRAMAVRPKDRFPSAGRLVDELDGAFRVSQHVHRKWWQVWR